MCYLGVNIVSAIRSDSHVKFSLFTSIYGHILLTDSLRYFCINGTP